MTAEQRPNQARRPEYHVATPLEREIAGILARGCAKFIQNVGKYRRDSDGSYLWAWTGDQVRTRLSEQEYKQLSTDIEQAPDRDYLGVPLTVNGVFVGHADTHLPYAHGGYFLFLNLDEKHWYDTRVITRFAQYGLLGPATKYTTLRSVKPLRLKSQRRYLLQKTASLLSVSSQLLHRVNSGNSTTLPLW